MNLKNQPPIFVPVEYRAEIEGLSKAALMDIAWNFAGQCADDGDDAAAMATFRRERGVVLGYRKSAKDAA